MQLNEIDMEKRKMLLRDFQNGLTRLQASQNIVEKFGDCIGYRERTCDRWFKKFKSGDFDLTVKPRDKSTKVDRSYSRKKSKRSTKTIKVNEVKFKQQELPAPTPMDLGENGTLENLIKSKPQLTISKVKANSGVVMKKLPVEANVITKRLLTLPPKPINSPIIATSNVPKETSAVPLEMPKLRPRRPRSKGIEIQLPVSAVKRMNPQTLTESHSIGEGNKGSTSTETAHNTSTEYSGSKEVTVQFQNLSPEVAKNTVWKNTKAVNKRQTLLQSKPQQTMLKITNVAHVESLSPEKNVMTTDHIVLADNKRLTLPSASGLNNQKGIIYLNPQEIFRQTFGGIDKSLHRPSPYVKSTHAQQTHKNFKTLAHPHPSLTPPPLETERQNSVTLCDSDDSGEDILFPDNARLPAPKIKSNTTYTTYWDMESGKQIHVDATEPILPQPEIPVIEID